MKGETYLLFEVAGSTYGLASSIVQHVDMAEGVTPVPNANPAIDGVVFSRGQVLPALNLRARFGFPRAGYTIKTRLICVIFRNRRVGLIVDSAREFLDISFDAIRPIQETLTGVHGNYLRGVAKIGERLILLPELEAVLDVGDTTLPGGEGAALGSQPALEPSQTN